jgi:hypothetical protein
VVEVFKTNVQRKTDARLICQALLKQFPSCLINFDLTDCDKILRIEGAEICSDHICDWMMEQGFEVSILV